MYFYNFKKEEEREKQTEILEGTQLNMLGGRMKFCYNVEMMKFLAIRPTRRVNNNQICFNQQQKSVNKQMSIKHD